MASLQEAAGLRARLLVFDATSRTSNRDIIHSAGAVPAAHGVARCLAPDEAGETPERHATGGARMAGGVALSDHAGCVPMDGQAWLPRNLAA